MHHTWIDVAQFYETLLAIRTFHTTILSLIAVHKSSLCIVLPISGCMHGQVKIHVVSRHFQCYHRQATIS